MTESEIDKTITLHAKGDIKIEKLIKVEKGAVYNDGGTVNVYHGNKEDDEENVTPNDATIFPLTQNMLIKYIKAGLLGEDLKPVKGLSNGQIAVLAHDIAERYELKNFWKKFDQFWGIKNLATYYSRFCNTDKAVQFIRTLNNL